MAEPDHLRLSDTQCGSLPGHRLANARFGGQTEFTAPLRFFRARLIAPAGLARPDLRQ